MNGSAGPSWAGTPTGCGDLAGLDASCSGRGSLSSSGCVLIILLTVSTPQSTGGGAADCCPQGSGSPSGSNQHGGDRDRGHSGVPQAGRGLDQRGAATNNRGMGGHVILLTIVKPLPAFGVYAVKPAD